MISNAGTRRYSYYLDLTYPNFTYFFIAENLALHAPLLFSEGGGVVTSAKLANQGLPILTDNSLTITFRTDHHLHCCGKPRFPRTPLPTEYY